MRKKADHVGRSAGLLWIAALVLLAGVLALTAEGGHVLRTVLDGHRERAQEASVSSFSLREQMGMEQISARVRGWQSMVSSEVVTVSTARGKLSAQLFAPLEERDGAPWALVLHGGLGTDHTQVLDVACALSLRGYRVLAPDLYAHGKSEGSLSSLGIREAEDVLAWVDWIMLEELDARIVCFGQDEGGAALLLSAAGGLPESVKAAAADSAYVSVQARAHELLAEVDAGWLGERLLEPAYRLAHGVSMKEGDITQRIAGANVPLLLIHGTGDTQVLAWQSEAIAEAAQENAQLLLVEGAEHGMARYLEPERYYDTLLSFFEDALAR
ncbi:MAG: alpha/beta hydrolase [Candidatus Ventricola sp.]